MLRWFVKIYNIYGGCIRIAPDIMKERRLTHHSVGLVNSAYYLN
jgi:hypothetical protein